MLKVLPEKIYNLIAAGEVIGRPSSVVKELMENSADAGATSITLIINDFGKTLIQVIDNGVGMNSQDAQLCFASHATSKLEKIEDLESIKTFGFRGEALASIAACADVTLKTKKRGEDVGTQVHISASKIESCTQIACAQGCNIAVRNLFYNIPARRKFLKSDSWEYKQILNEFYRVALTRLDIEFKLISNSKEIYNLPAENSLKKRIATLNKTQYLKTSKELIDISLETSVVKLSGCISTPNNCKKNQSNTFLFVNGRFFRSPLLHKAILNGYSNLIAESYLPAYYIFLQIPDGEFDINISPSKTEVKFENEQAIFQILEATVKEAIGKNAFTPVIDFETDNVPQEITSGDGFTLSKEEREEFRRGGFRKPQIEYDPLFNPFELNDSGSPQNYEDTSRQNYTPAYYPEEERSGFIVIDSNRVAVSNNLINNKIEQAKSVNKQNSLPTLSKGITVVDIVRARERIFFEEYLNSIERSNISVQENLFPVTLTLAEDEYKCLIENKKLFEQLGFEIREFGDNSVAISGTPSHFNGEKFSVEECIEDIINSIIENDNPKGQLEEYAHRIVRHTNFAMQMSPSYKYIDELLTHLFKCETPTLSPKGGYILCSLSEEEIDKRLM